MKRQIIALIALVFLLFPLLVGIRRLRNLPRPRQDDDQPKV